MKKIPLTQGKFALVDDEDYGELIKHKWYADETSSGRWAVVKHITVPMSRFLAKPDNDKVVDLGLARR